MAPQEDRDRVETAQWRRLAIVVNPKMRRSWGAIATEIARRVPNATAFEVLKTAGPDSVSVINRDAIKNVDAVIAIGGDGTVAEAATAVLNTGIPLGIIPAGSTNIVARDLGIPDNPNGALQVLFGEHQLVRIDAGLHNERVFLHMAGAGFDSRLFASTNPRLKKRIGWVAYLPAGGKSLFAPAADVDILADGDRIEAKSPLVMIANGGSVISPRLRIHPSMLKDDGWLDLIVVAATTPLSIVRTLSRAAIGQIHRSPYVTHRRVQHVELRSDPPLPVQLDGDVTGMTPAVFTIAPGAIRVIAPVL